MAFRRWIWVRDTATGHRFDLDERRVDALVKAGQVEVVTDYPVNEGHNVGPRPAKPHVDKLAAPSAPEAPVAATAPAEAPQAEAPKSTRKSAPAEPVTTTTTEGS